METTLRREIPEPVLDAVLEGIAFTQLAHLVGEKLRTVPEVRAAELRWGNTLRVHSLAGTEPVPEIVKRLRQLGLPPVRRNKRRALPYSDLQIDTFILPLPRSPYYGGSAPVSG